MHPSDDAFYARLFTLSDAELFNYIHHYSRYKVDAVYAALAALRTRGVYVSHDALSEIESGRIVELSVNSRRLKEYHEKQAYVHKAVVI